eukprot:TRINITY_DN40241_c0_g1_i1.p1 TRINITY_DN40241_c0_g1~~TRINITY_DN40241_c0_g1_i1.p1  ORF type:complete len:511 (+),score=101.01 TRINITY_DN40241_c0_g1_i1:92-1624(+)
MGKFKVHLYAFEAEGLVAPSWNSSLCLLIDFDDGYKRYLTEPAGPVRESGGQPGHLDWQFQCAFEYHVAEIASLGDRKLRVQCVEKAGNYCLAEAAVDLHTVATGPQTFDLCMATSMEVPQDASAALSFVCVMQMVSDVSVSVSNLRLDMQGALAAAGLKISASLQPEDDDVRQLPASRDLQWQERVDVSFEASLLDLLKAPEHEEVYFIVCDERGAERGQAFLPFRHAVRSDGGSEGAGVRLDAQLPFKVDVMFPGMRKDGVEAPAGTLEGSLQLRNLPMCAQMVGGKCFDGEVQGGFALASGLPFPSTLASAPAVWQEPTLSESSQCLRGVAAEALSRIPLPPYWVATRGDRPSDPVYFSDTRAQRTTLKDPRLLPLCWEQFISKDNDQVYFKYRGTHVTDIDPRNCPHGWDMRISNSGEIFFAYAPAHKTSFTDPRGLPHGIEAALDDKGRMYFKNHRHGACQWDDPRQGKSELILRTWRLHEAAKWWEEQVRAYIATTQQQAALGA